MPWVSSPTTVAKSTTSVIVSPYPARFVTSRADISHLAVWSNFEVADMDFWRAPAYTAYVDYLEASGGFYYEVRTSLSSPPLDIHPTLDALAVG
jgi:hypothetical protein